MSDQVDLLDAVLDKTGALIANTPPADAERPTPCPDLTVAALVDHLAEWIATFAESAAGSAPPEVGPQDAAWPAPQAQRFSAAARQAVDAFRNGALERKLTVMGGPIPGSMVVGMMLMEYLGHGWDLATATGQRLPYDDEEAAAALAAGKGMLTEQFRGPDKSFGPEVTVPSDATTVERLIGFLGRDPVVDGDRSVSRDGSVSPDGPWFECSWCDATILLSQFGVSEEEPGSAVAVCGSCHRRVFVSLPPHPTGG